MDFMAGSGNWMTFKVHSNPRQFYYSMILLWVQNPLFSQASPAAPNPLADRTYIQIHDVRIDLQEPGFVWPRAGSSTLPSRVVSMKLLALLDLCLWIHGHVGGSDGGDVPDGGCLTLASEQIVESCAGCCFIFPPQHISSLSSSLRFSGRGFEVASFVIWPLFMSYLRHRLWGPC